MDLSCNENTLINFNHQQLTKLTLYITCNFPKNWPCNLCQDQGIQGHKCKAKAGHSQSQGQQNWP